MQESYREYLYHWYLNRVEADRSYSLRRYAQDLGVSASTLSEVMNQKHNLSLKNARVICRKLGLNAGEQDHFLALVASAHQPGGTATASPQDTGTPFHHIPVADFSLISNWYHLAILAAAELNGGILTSSFIESRLGLSNLEARGALERLHRLGLIRQEGDGWVVVQSKTTTSSPTSSEAIQKFHTTMLQKATQALRLQHPDTREFSCNFVPVPTSALPELKSRMAAWRRQFADDLKTNDPSDRVYCLMMQLFAVDRENPTLRGGIE